MFEEEKESHHGYVRLSRREGGKRMKLERQAGELRLGSYRKESGSYLDVAARISTEDFSYLIYFLKK